MEALLTKLVKEKYIAKNIMKMKQELEIQEHIEKNKNILKDIKNVKSIYNYYEIVNNKLVLRAFCMFGNYDFDEYSDIVKISYYTPDLSLKFKNFGCGNNYINRRGDIIKH